MKHKTLLITIFSMFVALICFSTNVNAASANLSASKTTVTVGESVNINVSINAATWSLNVAGSGVTGDSIVGYNADGNNQSTSKSFNLDTSKAGTYTIKLAGDVTDGATDVNSVINKSVTVTVKEKETPKQSTQETAQESDKKENTGETKQTQNQEQTTTQSQNSASSNANLTNLGITPYDFKGFKSGTTTYNVTVPNEITVVSVYASVQEEGAVYHVTGNNNLDVGTNKITVTVTAPDQKTTKNYYIYVARKAAEKEEEVIPNVIEEKQEEQTEEKEKLGLLSIALDNEKEIYLEPEFSPEVYKYTVKLKEDLNSIKVNAIANREDAKVEITGNDKLEKEKNTILIKVTSSDEQEKVEYKITVIKEIAEEETEKIEAENIENESQKNETNSNNKWLIIGGIIAGVVVLIALVFLGIIIKTKRRGKH